MTAGRKIIAIGIWLAAAAFGAASGGCQEDRGPVSINSDDPDLKILAIKQDAATGNRKDIPAMVAGLSDDDSAIRFYCIDALQSLTGKDFGYHYYETFDQRAPAVKRWQEWLRK